jgi:hypothetical protein
MSGGCLAFPGWSEPWLLFAPLPPIIKDLTFKFVLKYIYYFTLAP